MRQSFEPEELFQAILEGKVRTITSLLEQGCDVNIQNNQLQVSFLDFNSMLILGEKIFHILYMLYWTSISVTEYGGSKPFYS